MKQRLIGATVLIVLAIIFVPMLLDGPKAPGGAETVDLSIPAEPSRDFETQVVPLTPPGQTPQPVANVPVPDDPNRIATVDTNAAARPDALTGRDAPLPTPSSPAPTPVETPAPTAPAATAPTTPPATTAPTPSATTPSTTTATAATPAAPTDPRGRYVVNYGSYGNAANVQALIADLRRLGVTATAEAMTADGKAVQRVRSGPYVDRTEAERVRLLVKQARADIPAAVVTIDDSPKADVPAAATGSAATGWAVQVGAFQAEADAAQLRDRLRAAGFNSFIDTVRAEKGTMYRVRVGPETQRANAERLRDALKTRASVNGLIVPHP